MWLLACVVLFTAGFATSVYSWPSIKVWINGASTEVERLRNRAVKLEAKLRDI